MIRYTVYIYNKATFAAIKYLCDTISGFKAIPVRFDDDSISEEIWDSLVSLWRRELTVAVSVDFKDIRAVSIEESIKLGRIVYNK